MRVGILAESIEAGSLNLDMKDPEASYFEVTLNGKPYPLIEWIRSRAPGVIDMLQMCNLDGRPFDVDLGDMLLLNGQFVEVDIDRCDERGEVLETWRCHGYATVRRGALVCDGHYGSHVLSIRPGV